MSGQNYRGLLASVEEGLVIAKRYSEEYNKAEAVKLVTERQMEVKAEAAFRIQKNQLSIRPVWHQKEKRVEAHILVCFLVFAMWKMLEMWQERSGLGNSPRTILDEFARIQSHDVILPTSGGQDIRLRCIALPDHAQQALLDRVGLEIPKRMRIDRELPVQMPLQ